ncbi:hypothetical protein ACQB60_29860 [Actinomycetota bacterium Odt1-20B]
MRERVALQGGSTVAGGLDGDGFRGTATLPTAPVDEEEQLG